MIGGCFMLVHQIHNSYGNYNYNAYIYTNIQYGNHFHKNYELLYVISGETVVHLNSNPITLSEGELLLISPYSIHSFTVNDKTRLWVGVFADDYVKSFAKKHSRTQYTKFKCEAKIDDCLKEYLFYQGTPELNMAKACFYMVCSECLKKASIINESTIDFKGKVIEYISDNLSDEISMSGAANSLGYEYHYFSSLFHKCFEMNFKEIVNLFRFEHAAEILLDKSIDISYIAGECGFKSIRNFNRVFKNLSGKTPTEYRNTI